MTNGVMLSAYPMFPCVDIARSIAFYETQLGFKTLFQHGDEYARVQRDSVILDLWKCTNPAMKGNEPGCWLVVENIDALFEEFGAKIAHSGIEAARPTVTDIELRPQGMKVFSVLDPDNNALHFSEGTT